MTTTSPRIQKSQIFAMLGLLGIALAVIKFSLAIAAFTPANQPIGYVAQDDVTNYVLNSGNETLYRTEYKRDYWGGNLYAYPVDAAGNVMGGADRWNGGAAAHIDAQNWNTGRFIATLNSTGAPIPFRAANLSAAQLATLSATIQTVSYSSTQIANFLRGDRSNESASGMRQRSTVLGDIVHTRPYYVSDATSPTVFVGSNDGMVHAINATDGTERWAYVPSMLIGKMKTLAYSPSDASQPYAHDYFVDGQLNISTLASAKRVLVGGLGSGGKGLFALNISNSAGLAATNETEVANKILWEITPTDISFGGVKTSSTAYAKLGYTYGTPTITRINNAGTAMDVVIIGNGYNDAATGESYLFVINAENGALVKAIQAGTAGGLNPNGLSTPAAIDSDANGFADTVYAGDLNGTMWKFDLSSATPAAWTASALLVTNPARSITTTPGVALHPNGGYMVSFGTGRVFSGSYATSTAAATGDLADTSINSVYGVWDGAPVANTAGLSQTLTERSYTDPNGVTTRVRRITANQPNWASGGTKYWKVDLPAGERVIGEGSFTENGRFYFIGYNPTVAPYAVSGTTTLLYGENWLMELNYLTGGSSATPFLDMNGDLLLNDADRIVYASGDTLPAGKLMGDPILTPNQDGIPVGKWMSRGVQSQPILVQLPTLNTTLFNTNPDVVFPPSTAVSRGVAGGHFDVDDFNGTNMNCSNVGAASGGANASGSINFSYSNSKNPGTLTLSIGAIQIVSGSPGNRSASSMESWLSSAINNTNNYSASINNNVLYISANNPGSLYNGAITLTYSSTALSSSVTGMTGGADPTTPPKSTSSTNCQYVLHHHEYDDEFDKTGVNFLNASDSNYNLANTITSNSTGFKVLMMNQYLSPAVSLHIGNPAYNPASAAGYVSVKNYQTASSLDITTVPSYNMSTIGSLAINMPVNAFSIKDWWGNGDARAGLHSVKYSCAWSGSGVDADMYQPVIPPANGVDGPGSKVTGQGARHNGALNIQIIKDTTPNSAIEQNVPGRPEYGYRVNQANFYQYVLAEYIVYWHHPRNMCYDTAGTKWATSNNNGDAWNTTALMTGYGWTKAPPEDNAVSTANKQPATGSTDPKLGVLGSTGTVSSTTSTVNGNVTTTTINYTDGTKQIIKKTENSNGTVSIVSTMYSSNGTVTDTTTEVIANAAGSVRTGGDERGLQARTGRVSWHEMIRD